GPAAFRVLLAGLVDGASGRVGQVRLGDVADDLERLAGDVLVMHAATELIARSPDRVGVPGLDRPLRHVGYRREAHGDAARGGAGRIFRLVATAPGDNGDGERRNSSGPSSRHV